MHRYYVKRNILLIDFKFFSYLACREELLKIKNIEKQVSSQLLNYGVQNIDLSTRTPWVSNFSWPNNSSKDVYVTFDFPHAIIVDKIMMVPALVSGFRPNMTKKEQCYVKRFVLEYQNSTNSGWIRLKKKDGFSKVSSVCIIF